MGEVKTKMPEPSSATLDVAAHGAAQHADITIVRLIQFLLGSRSAISALASHRDTFWLGLVFVISAGLVREHYQATWLQKPWLVAIPFIATVLLALVLFPLVVVVARQRGATDGDYWSRFRVFLGLLWMTAPLAWIFIIPVDRLMSADDAAIIKLWFLGIVQVWRIILVTRILATLFVPHASDVYFTGIFFALMLVVDTLFLCNFGSGRFVLMVGSASETPVAEFLAIHVLAVTSIIAASTWPIWLIGTLMVALGQGPRWSWTVTAVPSPRAVSTGVKVLAIASLFIWVALLPIAQPNHHAKEANEFPGRIDEKPEPVGTHAARLERPY